MGLLIFLLGTALAAGVVVGTFIALLRLRTPWIWRWSAVALALAAVVLSVWINFRFEYHAGQDLRVMGVPFPTVIFRLENDHWVDYVVAAPLLIVGLNVLIWVALFLLPVACGLAIRHIILPRRKRQAFGQSDTMNL
ncbi:MAG: hypothetical protein JW888_16665 [Pirellulales bacterium]|nr:hypothetical protein [Pirellulales bacterium]